MRRAGLETDRHASSWMHGDPSKHTSPNWRLRIDDTERSTLAVARVGIFPTRTTRHICGTAAFEKT
jgi:hypothetical protein